MDRRGDSRTGGKVKMLVLKSNNCDARVLCRLTAHMKVILDDSRTWDVMKTMNQCGSDKAIFINQDRCTVLEVESGIHEAATVVEVPLSILP